MDIRVDDGPCPVACPPTESFGAAMVRLREALAREGRVLVAVLIDGEEPTPERWTALRAEPVERLGRVRVTSASPLAAADSTLHTIRDALPALRAEQARAVETLQAGQRADGLAAFRRCVETWEVVHKSVLKVCEWMGGDPADLGDAAGALSQASQALAGALRRVQAALQADDVTALADTIEADLDPLVEDWQAILTAMTQRVQAAQNETNDA